jgi:hypothetical protein
MFNSKEKDLQIKKLQERVKELESDLNAVHEIIYETESINKFTLEELNSNDAALPILVVKFGDKNKGWIPGPLQIKAVLQQMKERNLHKLYNIIVSNYAFSLETFNTSLNLQSYDFRAEKANKK